MLIYINYLYNYFFKYTCKINSLIIWFYFNYYFVNERIFPSCINWGKNDSREHIINYEQNKKYFIDLSKKYINKIKKSKDE